MLDDILHSCPWILHVVTLVDLILRDVRAVLLSKLGPIRRSNDHVQNLELTFEVYELMELGALGRVLMVRLQASEVMKVMRVFGPSLYRVNNLEVLVDILEWIILEAIVLLAVEL